MIIMLKLWNGIQTIDNGIQTMSEKWKYLKMLLMIWISLMTKLLLFLQFTLMVRAIIKILTWKRKL